MILSALLAGLAMGHGGPQAQPQYSIEFLVDGTNVRISRFASSGNYLHGGLRGAGAVIGGQSVPIPMYYVVRPGPGEAENRTLSALDICNDGFWFGWYESGLTENGFAVPSGNGFREYPLPVRPIGLQASTVANSKHEVAFTGQLLGYRQNPPEFAYRFSFTNGQAQGLRLGDIGAVGSSTEDIDEDGNIVGFIRKAGSPNGPGPWKGYSAVPTLWLKNDELKILPIPDGSKSAAAMGLWSNDLIWGCGWSDKVMRFAVWKGEKLNQSLTIDKGMIEPNMSHCKTDGTPVITTTTGSNYMLTPTISRGYDVWQRVGNEWVKLEQLVRDLPEDVHLDALVDITNKNWLVVLGRKGKFPNYYLLKPLG